MSDRRYFAVIPAAGTGSRAGASMPKQYVEVAGKPMLVRTLDAFAAVAAIERIVVVIAPGDALFDGAVPAAARSDRVTAVRTGGATRAASVENGLAALDGIASDDDWVLVHDAARCGITVELIERLIVRVADDRVGGLLAVPLDDTVKRAAMDETRRVADTVDRHGLWRAQTPQLFRYRLLVDALTNARANGLVVTDEASALEAVGRQALLVQGSARNFKVTTSDDLAMMDRLLSRDTVRQPATRTADEPT